MKMARIIIVFIAIFMGGVSLASENDPFAYNEIKTLLASEKSLINYNMVSGRLCDLLREQKRLFTANERTGKNETAAVLEGLLNEAGLFASQSDYSEAFKILNAVHEKVMESLKQLQEK